MEIHSLVSCKNNKINWSKDFRNEFWETQDVLKQLHLLDFSKTKELDQELFLSVLGQKIVPEFYFVDVLETGGRQGGNCWEGKAEPFTNNQVSFFSEEVMNFITEIDDSVTLKNFQTIMSQVKTEEVTISEYYGNSTDYVVKLLPFSALDILGKEFFVKATLKHPKYFKEI